MCVHTSVYVCVCVCVCEREREREREYVCMCIMCVWMYVYMDVGVWGPVTPILSSIHSKIQTRHYYSNSYCLDTIVHNLAIFILGLNLPGTKLHDLSSSWPFGVYKP